MNDNHEKKTAAACRCPHSVGFGLALGAGVGAALMSATGSAAFLAAGVGTGVLVSYIINSRRRNNR